MNLPIAFWDSSALVPLCVQQRQTERSAVLFADYEMAVWWSTPVEIASGFSRLLRMGEIDHEELLYAKRLAQTFATMWNLVEPWLRIADQACLLLEAHPLSAADAMQLAAALEWCEGKPHGKVFITFDRRLRDAAEFAGFSLE